MSPIAEDPELARHSSANTLASASRLGSGLRTSMSAAWRGLQASGRLLQASGRALLHVPDSFHGLLHLTEEQRRIIDGEDPDGLEAMKRYAEEQPWYARKEAERNPTVKLSGRQLIMLAAAKRNAALEYKRKRDAKRERIARRRELMRERREAAMELARASAKTWEV